MNIWLVSRHYIGEQNTVNEYQEGAKRILAARDLIRDKGLPIYLGTKPTASQEKLSPDMKQAVHKTTSELIDAGVFVFFDPKDRGSGTSFSQLMYNPTFLSTSAPTVVMGHDIDQFTIDTSEALDGFVDFATQMVEEDSLWSSGSRNIEVKLGQHTRNSNLRIIQELFHSLTIGSKKLKIKDDAPEGVVPAYHEIGESTSAFGVLNYNHRNCRTLIASIVSYGNILAPIFASEYYTSIKASTLGNESPRYVSTLPNKYYVQKGEIEEFEGTRNFVRTSESTLAKTDVRDMLNKTVGEDETVDTISRYYDEDDVKLVQGWMLEALTK